ncbi:MAG: EAL domain-containing protein [Thiohalomonadales bacterium]
MFHTRDAFVVDELKMDRNEAANHFISNFNRLRDTDLTEQEEKILTQLQLKVQFAADTLREIIEFIEKEQLDLALVRFENTGYTSQKEVYALLAKFSELQEYYVKETLQAIERTKLSYQYWQVLLTLFLIMIGAVLAKFIIRQITATEYQLVKERKQAMTTLVHISDTVISVDKNQNIEYVNPAGEWLLNCNAQDTIGKKLHEILFLYNEGDERISIDFLNNSQDFPRGSLYQGQQLAVHNVYGDAIYVELEVTNYFANEQRDLLGYVVVIKDISSERESVMALQRQANTDLLTGLANRLNFERHLAEVLKGDRQGMSTLVFFMDLDKFKVINDSCGHQAGDKLLKEVAQLFLHNVRQCDLLARVGGDEFSILLKNCDLNQGTVLANTLIEALSTYRFIWEGEIYSLGVSIGITEIHSSHNASVEEVVKLADVACFRAKDNGRNTCCVCNFNDKDMLQKAEEKSWHKRIVRAMEKDEFLLFGQTIESMSAGSGNVDRRVEVLLRYRDEQGAIVLPGVFLPVAERYHKLVELDIYIINKVFALVQEHAGFHQADLQICINLSKQTVVDSRALVLILSKLADYSIRPGLICFEITESVAITHLDEAINFIQEIRSAGCKFALDNFGSRVSSFAYLQSLPIDYLKIDGNLVTQIGSSEVQYHIVEAVHKIGDIMGLRTVAEHIEGPEMLALVEKIGIHYAQGYYLAKPAPLESTLLGNSSENMALISRVSS